MYLYYLDQNSLKVIIEDQKTLILGVYEDNCVISSLFKGLMQQIKKGYQNDAYIGLIEKKAYEKSFLQPKSYIYPLIVVVEKGEIVKKIVGFKNYHDVCEELGNLIY